MRIIKFILVLAPLILGFTGASAVGQKSDVFDRKHIKDRMLMVAKWQLDHPKHDLNDWTNGAFYAGIFAAWETTASPELMTAMLEMGEKNGWKPGPRFDHADDIAISQTYLDLYRVKKDRRMLQPTIDTIEHLKNEKGEQAATKGITWWWCDALFMAPPTLVKLSNITGDKSYLELNDHLFKQTYDLLYDRDEKLYARDASHLINEAGEGKREANGKKVFWSRGNGWVAGGLVRVLKELPKEYPKREFYLTQYKALMERLLSLQESDGLWRSSLLDPEAYPGGEASGSGFDIYAMAWGINNKVLPRDKYLPAVKKAWMALSGLVHPDGMVGWTQPIGADPRKNFNADSWEVYGAGAFLLAGSEVVKR
ncbi:MAG TPA: glycoside hydrolase family 88 protein [Pyrinomonadaceae bacterium]